MRSIVPRPSRTVTAQPCAPSMWAAARPELPAPTITVGPPHGGEPCTRATRQDTAHTTEQLATPPACRSMPIYLNRCQVSGATLLLPEHTGETLSKLKGFRAVFRSLGLYLAQFVFVAQRDVLSGRGVFLKNYALSATNRRYLVVGVSRSGSGFVSCFAKRQPPNISCLWR